MKVLSFWLFAFLLSTSSALAKDQKIFEFSFFGKPVTVDCSNSPSHYWRAEFHANGLLRELVIRPYPYEDSCVSRNYRHEGGVGGVRFATRHPVLTQFDPQGRVQKIYSMETLATDDIFELVLAPEIGRLCSNGHGLFGAEATFYPNGAIRSFDHRRGRYSLKFAAYGQPECTEVKRLHFTEQGTLSHVEPW